MRRPSYCVHPKVVALSLAPLLVVGGAAGLLGYLYWEPAVAAVRSSLDEWTLVGSLFAWLDSVGGGGFRSVLAPLVIVVLAVPVCVVATLFVVALLMTPAIVGLVASRRFPQLERKRGGGFAQGVAASLGFTTVALMVLVASIPLWFVPPLVLVLPPLIWGWLTERVLSFDVLAEHASAEERRLLLRAERWPLLGMGVLAGYLGAAPSLLWAVSALTLVFAPLLILVSIWLYTLVFAFSSLWFAHYLLAALQRARGDEAMADASGGARPALPADVPPTTHPTRKIAA